MRRFDRPTPILVRQYTRLRTGDAPGTSVTYNVDTSDVEVMKDGLRLLTRAYFAAGAKKVCPLIHPLTFFDNEGKALDAIGQVTAPTDFAHVHASHRSDAATSARCNPRSDAGKFTPAARMRSRGRRTRRAVMARACQLDRSMRGALCARQCKRAAVVLLPGNRQSSLVHTRFTTDVKRAMCLSCTAMRALSVLFLPRRWCSLQPLSCV